LAALLGSESEIERRHRELESLAEETATAIEQEHHTAGPLLAKLRRSSLDGLVVTSELQASIEALTQQLERAKEGEALTQQLERASQSPGATDYCSSQLIEQCLETVQESVKASLALRAAEKPDDDDDDEL